MHPLEMSQSAKLSRPSRAGSNGFLAWRRKACPAGLFDTIQDGGIFFFIMQLEEKQLIARLLDNKIFDIRQGYDNAGGSMRRSL